MLLEITEYNMNKFPIPAEILNELKEIKPRGVISDPKMSFEIGYISTTSIRIIGPTSPKVFISKRSLKHIIDQRGSDQIIYEIPEIISNPTKIIDNSVKRIGSFIFAKMNGKAKGVVIEVTKTPDGNRVVSAFPINKEYYRRLVDISGRSDVSP